MRYVPLALLTVMSLGAAHSMANARADVLDGEYRTYYPSGRILEVRHYRQGREDGLQQAWTEDGQLYLNYEVRNGRRYGFVNARPCEPVHAAGVR